MVFYVCGVFFCRDPSEDPSSTRDEPTAPRDGNPFDVFIVFFYYYGRLFEDKFFSFAKISIFDSKNIKKDHQRPDDDTTKHHKTSDLIKDITLLFCDVFCC